MLRILVDTCVWLDLAKDYRNQPVIAALEDILNHEDFDLMVPEIVLDEFARNKDRVATDAKRSLLSHFSLVRDAVRRFGDKKDVDSTIKALNEADHSAVYKGEAVNESIERIERLLAAAKAIPATEGIKARAADRALASVAPCHRQKNSIGDAIIIETYADQIGRGDGDDKSAFITHNKVDFSQEGGNHRQPHADLVPLFDGNRSTYWVSLADLLNDLDVDLLANYDMELYGAMQVRGLSEILEAENLLFEQVWYNRHQNLRINIERGREKVVTEAGNAQATQAHDHRGHLEAGARRSAEDRGRGRNREPWTLG